MTVMKRVLPEPIKQPLRTLRKRVQEAMIRHGVLRKHLSVEALNRIFRRHRYWYLATYADNQLITRHNCDFLTSERFRTAYEFARAFTTEDREPWRNYLIQWAARQAVAVEGDVVECGTARGFTAATILSVVDLSRLNKRLYLFDSWSGVLPTQLTAHERTAVYGKRLGQVVQRYSGFYEEVQEAFSRFPCVTLVKGYIPDTLRQQDIAAVCFLHIDMNAVYPEVEALRYFWPRLSRGAWVILDDYAQTGREEQKRGMDALAEELGFEIFSCPTGQGVIVK